MIDAVLVDVEGTEYDLLPMFLKDGLLKREKLSICQLNLEAHNAKKKQFAEWITRVLTEEDWLILQSSVSPQSAVDFFRTIGASVNSSHSTCKTHGAFVDM